MDAGVLLDEYRNVLGGIENFDEYNLLLDPDDTNSLLASANMRYGHKAFAESPIAAMKAIKNSQEIEGFRAAMLRDGVAMVKFLKWLKPAVEAGGQTEISLDEKLTGLRKEQALFKDISFDTIVGYEKHGAIVHYEATSETDIPVEPRGFVLIDSGAQYLDGTTDITRTIALGPVTEEQRHVYTLVLKGHIQLELAKFPDGACGTQIDALARAAMWRDGMNFMHGTGHGVGSYLNVHEGPHQIRMEYKPAPLRAGMTVTDERKKSVDFTDPYTNAIQAIIVNESDSKVSSKKDLEGATVGVQLGTTGDVYVTDVKDAKVERFSKGADAVLALTQNKVDAVVIDNEPAKKFVEQNKGTKILDESFKNEDYAICLKKGSDLTEQFNKALKELKDDGTVKKIIDKYIKA